MPKRILQGEVVNSSVDKTIVVKVVRRFMHPLYKKTMRSTKKYMAHDPENKYKTGDAVKIIESIPLSKRKRWHVL